MEVSVCKSRLGGWRVKLTCSHLATADDIKDPGEWHQAIFLTLPGQGGVTLGSPIVLLN